jgi:Flp pilus assembly protein TadD
LVDCEEVLIYFSPSSYLEAEKDCTQGISLQPKNVKALWRRGIARRELGRVNEARKGMTQ